MSISEDMFESLATGKEFTMHTRWRLVTNRPNLFYMLSAGLVMGPTGFGKKYYADALSLFPGWIPLFPKFVPMTLVDLAVSERSHLRPCLVELNLAHMEGPCMVLNEEGVLREINFPTGLSGEETALFVPAPLPVSFFDHIVFETKEDKAQAVTDAEDYANVSLAGLRLRVERGAFAKATLPPWPPGDTMLSSRDQAPSLALAAGGVMAMLLHLGNRGELAVRASRLVFDPSIDEGAPIVDPMLRGIPDWVHTGCPPVFEDVSASLFWGMVNEIAVTRFENPAAEPTSVVLDYLTSVAADMDDRMRKPLERLADDLRGIVGFGDSTVSELLERHPKPFSAAMMLFFLREKCIDLLEFSHPLLREEHILLAAILFGARSGWLGLPVSLRDVPKLSAAVSHRMAVMEHVGAKTGLEFGPPPLRPRALREMLVTSDKGWNSRQKEAALILARAGGWDCVETSVTLGKGEYRMIVDGRGTHIVFAGEPKAVVTMVEMNQFFSHLTNATLTPQVAKKVRALLDK